MVPEFRRWVAENQAAFRDGAISVHLWDKTRSDESLHTDFKTDRFEATVGIWGSGHCDVHLLDWQEATEVVVTHYEFSHENDLFAMLDDLIRRMSTRSS